MGAEVSPLSGRDTIVLSRVDAVNAVYMRDIPERVGWLAEQGRRRVRVRAQVRCLRSRSAKRTRDGAVSESLEIGRRHARSKSTSVGMSEGQALRKLIE